MKELLIQLRTLFESSQIKVTYNGNATIPYELFTFNSVSGQCLTFEFSTEEKRYNFVITVPEKESEKMTWALNKVTPNGAGWTLVQTGRLRALSNIEELIGSLTKEIQNGIW